MVHAIRIHQTGGPEVMKWESVEVPAPGPGQVRLKQHAIGVNYIDTYQRSGLYKMPLPFMPGQRGRRRGRGGRPGRDRLQGRRPRRLRRRARRLRRGAGDAGRPAGQAARQHRLQDRRRHDAAGHDGALPAARRPTRSATARRCCCTPPPAASASSPASGRKHLGATIIGTVSSADKAELAKAHGCTHVINYKTEDFVKRTKELTNGQGVDVVYDARRQGHLSRARSTA